ncbi:hypothetical protein GCK32_004413 [Trichostrongylus colubriformis]|uniref:Small ribosomal subunit protein uS7m n=1 Tax=Trichostrongylus colubriformis TaxID=6319 RepID=A0AAN8J2Y0_TRICO
MPTTTPSYLRSLICDNFFLISSRSSDASLPNSSLKLEHHDFDMKRDFCDIVKCKPWTASKIFDGDLQLSKFLPNPEHRTFEDLNDISNIPPSPKLKTAQVTLERNEIAKNPQRKSNYLRDLKYDKFETCEKELRRGHSSPLTAPCAKDIVITCTVVIPHNKILSQEETRSTRLLLPERKLMLRGESTLMNLRQKILCICDSVVALEDGHELDPIDQSKTHMLLYPSSFIFIHDTFYVDYSMPHSQDISARPCTRPNCRLFVEVAVHSYRLCAPEIALLVHVCRYLAEEIVLMSSRSLRFLTTVRGISHTPVARDCYDPRVFREAITDIKQVYQPLDENDERNFLYIKAMKSDETPVFYRDHTVDKLIRVCMKSGNKETTKHHVYSALEIIKRRQYKAWLRAKDDEEKSKIELDPFVIARKAIENCHPLMKLQGVTRVPFPIEKAEAEFRAMKMMRDICRQKAAHGETHLKDILANELLAASQNEGLTIQAKQELHKTCEANRAYAHYR